MLFLPSVGNLFYFLSFCCCSKLKTIKLRGPSFENRKLNGNRKVHKHPQGRRRPIKKLISRPNPPRNDPIGSGLTFKIGVESMKIQRKNRVLHGKSDRKIAINYKWGNPMQKKYQTTSSDTFYLDFPNFRSFFQSPK